MTVTVILLTFVIAMGCRLRDFTDNYGHDGPIEIYTNELPVLELWKGAANELEYEFRDPNGYQREGL